MTMCSLYCLCYSSKQCHDLVKCKIKKFSFCPPEGSDGGVTSPICFEWKKEEEKGGSCCDGKIFLKADRPTQKR